MFKLYNNYLPSIFQDFFTPIDKVHSYNTRLSTKKTYYLPNVRTNYGLFNIRFKGCKIWNDIENIKQCSLKSFKKELKSRLISKYS